MVNRIRKKIFTALSATIVVAMLVAGVLVVAPGKTTLEVAKDAGAKKVEVIKA